MVVSEGVSGVVLQENCTSNSPGTPVVARSMVLCSNLSYWEQRLTDDRDVKPGDTDSLGDVVARVYARTDTYSIYTTTMGAMRGGGSPSPPPSEGVAELLGSIGELVTLHPGTTARFNAARAFGLKLWFDGQLKPAETSLRNTFHGISAQIARRATLAYLLGAIAASALASVGFSLGWQPAAGALGGFLSVAGGARRLDLDPSDDFRVLFVYGALRISIALVSSVIVLWLVDAGLLLNALTSRSPEYGRLVACAVAGFSEKLVPNSLLRIVGDAARRPKSSKEKAGNQVA